MFSKYVTFLSKLKLKFALISNVLDFKIRATRFVVWQKEILLSFDDRWGIGRLNSGFQYTFGAFREVVLAF